MPADRLPAGGIADFGKNSILNRDAVTTSRDRGLFRCGNMKCACGAGMSVRTRTRLVSHRYYFERYREAAIDSETFGSAGNKTAPKAVAAIYLFGSPHGGVVIAQ